MTIRHRIDRCADRRFSALRAYDRARATILTYTLAFRLFVPAFSVVFGFCAPLPRP
jgi:hypothetical protein